ncbi:MAG: acyl carrier protein [Chloroflexi bacterium HGW-Chloroflexi-10]|jgi:acyl carrier protein|nr:MAG: acyl carrier protein [Chloroflexi bacterium HGW-Chloroflexi-10]
MEKIESKIKEFISENILFSDNGYPYQDQDSFLEKGIVDSMNVMEIVAYVEDTFGVHVEDLEITPANFDSIASISTYIRQKQN